MEEFIEYIKILINTLGFKVFEPLINQDLVNSSDSNEKLYIKLDRGADAVGKRTPDGFVAFCNLKVTNNTVKSYGDKGLNKLRDELIENKIIVEINSKLIFKSDYLFSSPSASAMVIMGRSANGLLEWKDSSGKILRDIEKQEIKTASKQTN